MFTLRSFDDVGKMSSSEYTSALEALVALATKAATESAYIIDADNSLVALAGPTQGNTLVVNRFLLSLLHGGVVPHG